MKRQVKGKAGQAAQYVTRAQALKKLQLSLSDFRRLCILKGVYPRAPQKKTQGADKTYYHVRDIRYMAADPIRFQLYSEEAADKKKSKLVGQGHLALARDLEKRTSRDLDLSHVIRERYPSFTAALMDLDDCVSTLALIGSIPTDRESKFSAAVVAECSNLYTEFLAYVAATKTLTKTFASIKGFYFQANLPEGAKVTWLHPHRFANEIPADVDMKVLSTFSLWYRTLMRFVLFKLYQGEGVVYPVTGGSPKVKASQATYLNWIIKKKFTQNAVGGVVGGGQGGDVAVGGGAGGVFTGIIAMISREVPVVPVFLTLWAGGAKEVLAEVLGDVVTGEVTHVVVDRPATALKMTTDREYVQPQYVLDALNEGMLLSTKEYVPGATLPAHLSPFAAADEEYMPQRRVFLDERKKKRARAVDAGPVNEDEQQTEVEQRRLRRLAKEAKGEAMDEEAEEAEKEPEVKEKKKAKELKTDTTVLLSKKHRRLLEKIEGGQKIRKDAAQKLRIKANKQ